MQPSYIVCKLCGYVLKRSDYPLEVISSISFPTDDEQKLDQLKQWAKQNLPCPRCGNRKWIRKAYYKV